MRTLLTLSLLTATALGQGYVASTDLSNLRLGFDGARDRLLGFGDETVVQWDGSHWLPLTGVTPGRLNSMIYVPWERRIVATLGPSLFAFDGGSWQQLHGGGPWWLGNARLFVDTVNRELYAATGGVPGVVQRWNGAGWDNLGPTPAGRVAMGYAFDDQRSTFVLEALDPTTSSFDTYELTTGGWALRHSGTEFHGILAYDHGRQLVVGIGGNPYRTWAWDGATWTVLFGAAATPRSVQPEVADPGTGRLFCVSRATGRGVVHVLDAGGWSVLPMTHPPVALTDGPGLSYDSSRSRAVLVGDESLHEYDGEVWHDLPFGAPRARRWFGQAYDAARQQTVIFGGQYPSGNTLVTSNDTSLWDGTNWTTIAGAGPSPRTQAAMTYDVGRQVIVLVGGRTGIPTVQSYATDHWEWNGQSWTQIAPVTPVAAGSNAMGHDPVRARTVLVDANAQTWEYDGIAWLGTGSTALRPAGQRLVWDAGRQRIVGPLIPTTIPATTLGIFAWDGVSWAPVAAPAERFLAYDAARDTMLYWAAGEMRATSPLPATVEPYGNGCGGQTVVTRLAANGRPLPGAARFGVHLRTEALLQPAAIALGVGRSNTPIAAGCVLAVQNPIAVTLHSTTAEGIVERPIALPANPALAGTTFTAQGAAIAPGSPGGIVTSQGLEITIGG